MWGFIIWACVDDNLIKYMTDTQTWITDTLTWLYVGATWVWLMFLIYLYFSKYGSIKLGDDNDKPT